MTGNRLLDDNALISWECGMDRKARAEERQRGQVSLFYSYPDDFISRLRGLIEENVMSRVLKPDQFFTCRGLQLIEICHSQLG